MTQDTILPDLMDKSSFDFATFQREAMEQLKAGKPLIGQNGILTPLIKQMVQASLEGEMEHHLALCEQDGVVNRRNGKTRKQVKSAHGTFELETPRDRDGSFEPELIKKRQTILNESLDNKILDLYGLGTSYSDITYAGSLRSGCFSCTD